MAAVILLGSPNGQASSDVTTRARTFSRDTYGAGTTMLQAIVLAPATELTAVAPDQGPAAIAVSPAKAVTRPPPAPIDDDLNMTVGGGVQPTLPLVLSTQ